MKKEELRDLLDAMFEDLVSRDITNVSIKIETHTVDGWSREALNTANINRAIMWLKKRPSKYQFTLTIK